VDVLSSALEELLSEEKCSPRGSTSDDAQTNMEQRDLPPLKLKLKRSHRAVDDEEEDDSDFVSDEQEKSAPTVW